MCFRVGRVPPIHSYREKRKFYVHGPNRAAVAQCRFFYTRHDSISDVYEHVSQVFFSQNLSVFIASLKVSFRHIQIRKSEQKCLKKCLNFYEMSYAVHRARWIWLNFSFILPSLTSAAVNFEPRRRYRYRSKPTTAARFYAPRRLFAWRANRLAGPVSVYRFAGTRVIRVYDSSLLRSGG